MAKTGGSATLYGVLFQILGSIHWGSLYFKGVKRADDLVSAQLAFEPIEGGDFEIDTATARLVQQWKSRTSGRPWTIRSIVQDALPDLVRAVDLSQVDKQCTYQFMTEGRCSNWAPAKRLFDWMREQKSPVAPLEQIALAPFGADRFFSSRAQRSSPSAFFSEVLQILRERTGTKELSPRIVWHLLANLEVHAEILQIELRAKVNEFISTRTNTPDDVEAVRGRLCNLVLELASESGRRITPKEFFRMAELDNISLDDWRTVFGQLNGKTAQRTHDLFQFNGQYDVRSRPERLDDVPILFLTGRDEEGSPGESGKGKSFALGAIGNAAIGATRVVHAGRATGDASATLQIVADFIWKTGFQRTTNITLESLATTASRNDKFLPRPNGRANKNGRQDNGHARPTKNTPQRLNYKIQERRLNCPDFFSYQVKVNGLITITINTDHAFYDHVYAPMKEILRVENRQAIECFLLAAVRAEVSVATDGNSACFDAFRTAWSDALETFLDA